MIFQTIRKNLGLSQLEFGRLLGVSGRTVSRWETGSTTPTALALASLAWKLNGKASAAFPASVWDEYLRLQGKACGQTTLRTRRKADGPLPVIARHSSKRGAVQCRDCPADATHYDHRDYLSDDVEAVCQSCNSRRGLALNTFLNHWDYWQRFDWNEKPRTGRWAYANKSKPTPK